MTLSRNGCDNFQILYDQYVKDRKCVKLTALSVVNWGRLNCMMVLSGKKRNPKTGTCSCFRVHFDLEVKCAQRKRVMRQNWERKEGDSP